MFLYRCFCPGHKQGPYGAHKKVLSPSDWSTRDRMDIKSFSKFLCMYLFIYLFMSDWMKENDNNMGVTNVLFRFNVNILEAV